MPFTDTQKARVFFDVESTLEDLAVSLLKVRALKARAVAEGWATEMTDFEDRTKADLLLVGNFIDYLDDAIAGQAVTPVNYRPLVNRLAPNSVA